MPWKYPEPRAIVRPAVRLLFSLALAVGLWLLAAYATGISRALLPTPWQVFSALIDLFTNGGLAVDIWWSLRRAAAGLVLGGALGVLCGTVTGRISAVDWLLVPVFNGLRALPPVAMVPLVVVWAGLGEESKIFVTSWAAFFPIWLNTHAGVASVDRTIIWAARSLGARGVRLLYAVMFPAALPQVLVGFRLAISSTLICVVVAEMTGAYVGLGYRLNLSYLVFRVDRMLACMVVLAILGLVCDRGFTVVAARIFPWIALTSDRP